VASVTKESISLIQALEPPSVVPASAAAAAERAADWEAAYFAHQRLFWAAVEAGDREGAVDALRGQSRALQHRKKLEEAEEFAELSLTIAERSGCSRAAARALNALAIIHFLRHDSVAAGALHATAMELATDCGDDALVGWSCQNLGVLANLRGDLREARALYLESIASSVRSGDTTTAVSAYNSLGMISADLEEWTDSVLYYDRGLEVADELGDVAIRATILVNRAEPLIFIGEMEQALVALDQAESLAQEIGDQRTLSEIHRFRAVMALQQDCTREAEAQLELAIRTAEAAGLDLERAEATEVMALLRWQEGRHGAARIVAREALREYERLGAALNAGHLRNVLAKWAGGAAT
jgi:tetratricopeptide (TPR) repeat protein